MKLYGRFLPRFRVQYYSFERCEGVHHVRMLIAMRIHKARIFITVKSQQKIARVDAALSSL